MRIRLRFKRKNRGYARIGFFKPLMNADSR
jgi:hypothetical protein